MGHAYTNSMNPNRDPKLTIVLRGAGDGSGLKAESRMSRLRAVQPARVRLAVSRRRSVTKAPLKTCDVTHLVLWECIRL